MNKIIDYAILSLIGISIYGSVVYSIGWIPATLLSVASIALAALIVLGVYLIT